MLHVVKKCLEVRQGVADLFLVPEPTYVFLVPEPTARSAVPGASPGRGLLIPHGYLHPDKSEHSEVQSPSIIAGASLCFMGGPPTDLQNMADRQE